MSEEKDKQEPGARIPPRRCPPQEEAALQEKMFNDPETYRKMAEPFPTIANAEAETEAFFDGVAALRKRHNIANVYMILKDAAVRDGAEAEFFLTGGMGNSLEFESMLA